MLNIPVDNIHPTKNLNFLFKLKECVPSCNLSKITTIAIATITFILLIIMQNRPKKKAKIYNQLSTSRSQQGTQPKTPEQQKHNFKLKLKSICYKPKNENKPTVNRVIKRTTISNLKEILKLEKINAEQWFLYPGDFTSEANFLKWTEALFLQEHKKMSNIPINWSLANGFFDRATLMIKIGPAEQLFTKLNPFKNSPIHIVVGKGYTNKTSDGQEIIHSCYDVVKEMLAKVDETNKKRLLNQQNARGDTPLHLAYLRNDTEMIELLEEHGADKTILNNKDQIPKDARKIYDYPILDYLEKKKEYLNSFLSKHLEKKKKQPIQGQFPPQDLLTYLNDKKSLTDDQLTAKYAKLEGPRKSHKPGQDLKTKCENALKEEYKHVMSDVEESLKAKGYNMKFYDDQIFELFFTLDYTIFMDYKDSQKEEWKNKYFDKRIERFMKDRFTGLTLLHVDQDKKPNSVV